MHLGSSITQVIDKAKATNNLRLNSMAMTPSEISCAEKAVARGLMVKKTVNVHSYGPKPFYCIKVKA
jgi:hypothetical protein